MLTSWSLGGEAWDFLGEAGKRVGRVGARGQAVPFLWQENWMGAVSTRYCGYPGARDVLILMYLMRLSKPSVL